MHKLYFGEIGPYLDEQSFAKVYGAKKCNMQEDCFIRDYGRVSEYRKKKIDRCVRRNDKAASLAAEMLFIDNLTDWNVNYSDIEIKDNEYGKPYIVGTGNLYFNISHSGCMVMLGIADEPIGVDIQELKEMTVDITNRFYHENECRLLSGMDNNMRDEAFFRIWTLKESFVKQNGQGLSYGMSKFDVTDYYESRSFIMQKNDKKYAYSYWT